MEDKKCSSLKIEVWKDLERFSEPTATERVGVQ